jgi:hypothetical protein
MPTKGPLFVTSRRCASKILRHKNFGGTALTSTPGVMVSGPVIPFELKDGRIVRKYFYGHKTKKDVELPADFPIPGWGVAEEPSWLKALHDSYDSPLVDHIGGIACT